jgi:hypothetical protein
MQGRPQLFKDSRQISVLVSAEDYTLLNNMVEKARVGRPGYSFGDLLRTFIRRALDQDPEIAKRLRKLSPAKDRVRRLHAIARSASRLAHELDKK